MPNHHDLSHLSPRQGYTLIRIEEADEPLDTSCPDFSFHRVQVQCPDHEIVWIYFDPVSARFIGRLFPDADCVTGINPNEIFTDVERETVAKLVAKDAESRAPQSDEAPDGRLRVYTCVGFEGHWPVGISAVIVAEDEDAAREQLTEALGQAGLAQETASLHLVELDLTVEGAVLLQDGNY